MTKIFITISFFICSWLASAQGQYEQGMQKAFALWGEGKSKEASDLFERIASAEKNNWLPNYYVALVNTTTAFQTQDKEVLAALLAKAQTALDSELDKAPDNAELLVVQALIYTAWIVADPMTNGMKYSAKALEEYDRALKSEPNNPRAVFGKAEFEIGGAKYFGTDTTPMCQQVERSIGLFEVEKPASPFHPNWGLDRARETLTGCAAPKK